MGSDRCTCEIDREREKGGGGVNADASCLENMKAEVERDRKELSWTHQMPSPN